MMIECKMLKKQSLLGQTKTRIYKGSCVLSDNSLVTALTKALLFQKLNLNFEQVVQTLFLSGHNFSILLFLCNMD